MLKTMRRVIVDGMNVIGSRPNGWWRDRDGAVRRLAEALAGLSRKERAAYALVLDGRPLRDLPEGRHEGILIAYARRTGRNAADDRIADEVANDAHPQSLEVVTSDRALRERVQRCGARVVGAGDLLARIDALEDIDR